MSMYVKKTQRILVILCYLEHVLDETPSNFFLVHKA